MKSKGISWAELYGTQVYDNKRRRLETHSFRRDQMASILHESGLKYFLSILKNLSHRIKYFIDKSRKTRNVKIQDKLALDNVSYYGQLLV